MSTLTKTRIEPKADFQTFLAVLQESCDLQRAILDELRELNAEKKNRQPLSYTEYGFVHLWIQAVKGKLGSEPHTVHDCLRNPTFRELAKARTPRDIGNLLARACGQDIAGFIVESAGKDHGRVLWRILVKTS